jgi:hypothetical protein
MRSTRAGVRRRGCTSTIPSKASGLSAEDSAALHAIMSVGSQERLGFLG